MMSIAAGIIGGSLVGWACAELSAKKVVVVVLGLTICLVGQHL